ncbi:vacuolar protein sorting-associated protein 52 A-like isoform X2 [Phoenix dactylifera]|uniref:Vacuolar protein sorting-associated protein 52 A-like isoform X2 n=1 Tax=Phoenix dactylifera TaxID=42345 RepID=A0A8B8ZI94_PHODC|nr:vacuolar protein sorting-associated protein 52 A-like isoform X2 [Phoenix dactylifera]
MGIKDDLLQEHFSDLVKFVKAYASEDQSSSMERLAIAHVEPLVKDFASRWKAAVELMLKDVITSFSNLLCIRMEILKEEVAQLLEHHSRLSECVKLIKGAQALGETGCNAGNTSPKSRISLPRSKRLDRHSIYRGRNQILLIRGTAGRQRNIKRGNL